MKSAPPPTPFSTPWNFFRKVVPLCGKIAESLSRVRGIFPLRGKNPPIFPHCGKKVSTPWKILSPPTNIFPHRGTFSAKLFHCVENFFKVVPLCGKFLQTFSIAWKKFVHFSTLWKKSFHTVEKSLRLRHALLAALLASPFLAAAEPAEFADTPQLARELAANRQHNAAAIEYRRLALADPDSARAAGWFWLAAQQYASDHNPAQANRMLDRAEDTAPGSNAAPVAWLRAENALALRDWDSAGFYFDSLRLKADAPPWRDIAARGAATAALRSHDIPAARAALATSPTDPTSAITALDAYAARRDKKPWLGGLLGLVPGLGYAYSGEYANATRSLILNSLFLWGMIETADDDQWAAFTVLTFVEFTWYTGSIYGGLDAAHRHNQRRLDDTIAEIRGTTRAQPDFAKLPILVWQFEF